MEPSMTHLRRSVHSLPGARNRDVSVVSWYNLRLQTWQASSPDFPYFAEARASACPTPFLLRKEAVAALLGRIETVLRAVPRPDPAQGLWSRLKDTTGDRNGEGVH